MSQKSGIFAIFVFLSRVSNTFTSYLIIAVLFPYVLKFLFETSLNDVNVKDEPKKWNVCGNFILKCMGGFASKKFGAHFFTECLLEVGDRKLGGMIQIRR